MQRGFTAIELIIVVCIVAIFASIAVPNISQSLAERDFDNAARVLAADIRWLQQLSINDPNGEKQYQLMFDVGTGARYMVTQYDPPLINKVIKTVAFPASVVLANQPGEIKFNASGAPAGGGHTITLKSTKLKKLKYIIIAGATGRVRISDAKTAETGEL